MQSTRRHFLTSCGGWLALGGTGLLVACQSQQQPITVTNAPAPSSPTSAPVSAASPSTSAAASPAAAGSPSPAAVAAASPAVQPAASAVPSPSPSAAVASASPAPAAAASGLAGKPMYQMDPQHTGRSPYRGAQQISIKRTFNTNQPDLRPDDALAGPDIQSSTAVGPDGTIYATNFVGWLFALKDSPSASDALDLAWRFRPPSSAPFHCTPAVSRDGSTVFVAFTTKNGDALQATLFALRAPASGQDGQVVWQADLGPSNVQNAQNSPTLAQDGTIYIVNTMGVLSAIDSTNGSVKWTAQVNNGQTAQFGQTVKVAPAIGPDGTIYTTTLTGSLYAVSPQGSVKWNFDFGQHLGPTPLVSSPVTGPPNRGQDAIGSAASATIGPDGTIYVGSNNSNFYAIDPNGQQKWLFEAERELAGIWTTAALSADASTLYFGANKGGIYALNTRDGSLKWQFNIVGSVFGSPALDATGNLYTGSTVGHIFALAAATGERSTDLDVGAPIWTAASIRPDGSVVVGDRNGRIIVLSG